MLKNLSRVCLFISLLGASNVAFAQGGLESLNNLVPPSPEASSRLNFIEVPVSHYTGLPRIDIPLFVLNEGVLSVPISLKYHAGANRVESIAPDTGLGWSLLAGGSVSRVVRGLPDDASGIAGEKGFIAYSQQAGIDVEYLNGTTPGSGRWTQLQLIAEGCADSEPDVFYFDVNGISGKFSFDWDGNLLVDSNQKVEIEPHFENDDRTKPILSWSLIDGYGNVYLFTERDTTTINGYATACASNQTFTSSWYLSSITDVNGLNAVQFSYDSYPIYTQYNRSISVSQANSSNSFHCAPGSLNENFNSLYHSGKALSSITTSNGEAIRFNRVIERTDLNDPAQPAVHSLDEIIFENSLGNEVERIKLLYDYSTNRLTLKELSRCGVGGTSCFAPYIFNYASVALPEDDSPAQDHWGYFNGASNSNLVPGGLIYGVYRNGANRSPSAQHMGAGLLESMINPLGGKTEFEWEPHDYAATQDGGLTEKVLVNRTASAIQTGSCDVGSTSCPEQFHESTFTVQIAQPYSLVNVSYHLTTYNQGTSFPYFEGDKPVKAEILDSNNNTVYVFTDRNVATQTSVQLSPGTYKLRAYATWKEPTTLQSDRASITLSWQEETAQTVTEKMAGGMRILRIKDYDQASATTPSRTRRYNYDFSDGRSSGIVYQEHNYIRLSQSFVFQGGVDYSCEYMVRLSRNVSQLGTTSGSHIGYQEVTELLGENGEFGKTELSFTSPVQYSDFINDEVPFAPNTSFAYKTGFLTKRTDYKYTSGGFQEVRTEDNDPVFVQKEVPSFKVIFLGGRSGAAYLDKYKDDTYSSILGHARISKTKITTHAPAADFVQETNFEYDSDLQNLKTESFKDSQGMSHSAQYFYPGDYQNLSSNTPIHQLNNKHLVSGPIEVIQTVGDNVKGGYYTEFETNSGQIHRSRVFKISERRAISGFDFSFDNADGVRSTDYDDLPEIHYQVFDEYGNVVQAIDKATNITTSYLFGYGGKYMVAKIEGATYSEVIGIVNKQVLKAPSTDAQVRLEIDKIRAGVINAYVTTFTHKPGVGMTSQTSPNGLTIYYEYDSLNRLKYVRDHEDKLLKANEYAFKVNVNATGN